MKLVRELQKNVSVDLFGKCGQKGQPTKRYKFVLAFENSLCADYVTEKYYRNGLLDGYVPIVFGAANYSDPNVAIPGSFVDARAFASVRDLARYISYLNENDDAYNKYFAWKSSYRVRGFNMMCDMCAAMWKKERVQRYEFKKFFSVKETCADYDMEVQKYIDG